MRDLIFGKSQALRNRPQGLSTSFSAISGNFLAFVTTDVDLSLAVARATFELP